MIKGIRGFFMIRDPNFGQNQLLDIGTPESDTAIVQALRELAQPDHPGEQKFIYYQPWVI